MHIWCLLRDYFSSRLLDQLWRICFNFGSFFLLILGTCHLSLKAGPTPGFPVGGGKWKTHRTGMWNIVLSSCQDNHRSGQV